MVRDSVGLIFGETGTLDFKFLISDSTAVQRGEYVKAWHETDGWVLAQVLSITRSSDTFSFENAKSGKRADKSTDRITAEAIVIGRRDGSGLLRGPMTPFSPGDPIYKADKDLICSVLGLEGNEMYIGLLDGTDIPVSLSVNSLVQKHCSILAKTGSGKSYTAGVLLEELLDKGVPLLILDPHSEYASLKDQGKVKAGDQKKYHISPKGYGSKVTVFTPANKAINPVADEVFRLNGMNLSAKDIMAIFPNNFTSTHMGILYEAIQKVKAEMESYTLDDIIFEVGNVDSKAKWNVISLLEDIREAEILSNTPTTIEDLMQKGKAAIIDFKGVAPDMQNMIVARLCNSLFEARKVNTIPPGMLVVEEAHNFAPERGFSKTVSSEILRTIASEGRKFGLGMMVISQRPARVDKNVLSQCGSQIIMKVTNPNDLKSISKGLEGVNSYVEEELIRLPPGVAMLVSNDIERPILVDIRIRKSRHGGESVNVMADHVTRSAPKKRAAPAEPKARPPEKISRPPEPKTITKEPKAIPAEPEIIPAQPEIISAEPARSFEPAPEREPVSQGPPPMRKPSRPPKQEQGTLFKKIFGAKK